MGNDIDICSKDEEFDKNFIKNFGPSDENSFRFIKRSFDRFLETLVSPKRKEYETNHLHRTSNGKSLLETFDVTEFKIASQGNTLHTCFWKNKMNAEFGKKTCIIYLHTNISCIVDALEVIPVVEGLNANLLAFDLPGCGKSSGNLNDKIDADLALLIEWAKCLLGEEVKIIVWARGMSTGIVIKYLSSAKNYNNNNSNIIGITLDTPYLSVRKMIDDLIKKFATEGYVISKGMIKICINLLSSSIGTKLNGLNPLNISPIDLIGNFQIPCYIISALNDDYIPAKHGEELALSWNGVVSYKAFSGKHFGERNEEVVVSTLSFFQTFL